MKQIHTNKLPQAIGSYSQAILVENGTLYCSGQIGLHPQTGELAFGIEFQAKQIMENIQALIEELGYSLENICKTTLYLTDMNDFKIVDEIYGSFFGKHKPTRSTVAVSQLPKNALVEIEVIAYKKS